jgi:hypothetical protein
MKLRSLLISSSILAVACGHAPPSAAAAARALDTPQLVVSPPPRTLYRYVGRVEGVACSPDLVQAARVAQDDLRWKAHVRGADVVRIDYVAVPPDHASARPRVLLAGRAYKAIDHR